MDEFARSARSYLEAVRARGRAAGGAPSGRGRRGRGCRVDSGAGAATRGDRAPLGAGWVRIAARRDARCRGRPAGRRGTREKTVWRRWRRSTSPPRAGCWRWQDRAMEATLDRSSQRHGDPSHGGYAAGDARGAGRGRRLRRGPDGEPARGVRGRPAGQGGGAVRAFRDDDQPDRGPGQHEPRRRGAPARGLPHLRLRGRRPGDALQRPTPHPPRGERRHRP